MVNLLLFFAAFFFMEFVAWSNHKYIMHGKLWKWHKDHHRKDYMPIDPGKFSFEKNDRFFLVYALPAMILIFTGLSINIESLVFMGSGITLYGVTYLVIHDVIIHNRFNVPFLQKRHNFYIKALIKAHEAHHRPVDKADFLNFGLLIFPLRYFKK